MKMNLENAVRDYSGTVPIGLYVNKLDKNVNGMNQKYYEIKILKQFILKNFGKENLQNYFLILINIWIRQKFKVLDGINYLMLLKI